MKNEKIPTSVGTIILVIIAVTVGMFLWEYEKNQGLEVQLNEIVLPISKSNAEWKTYRNDDLGITFSYPTSWGEVTIGNGNIDKLKVPPCKTPLMMSYAQKSYPWGAYSSELKFSRTPIDLSVKILDLTNVNIPKQVCNENGKVITASTIQPKIQGTDNVQIINKSGLAFISDPSLLTSTNTNLEGPTYATRRDKKLVWVYSGFTPAYNTPEEIELRKYTNTPACQGANSYNTEKGCGLVAWVQNGTSSEKIRKSFSNLEEVVQSFEFNK